MADEPVTPQAGETVVQSPSEPVQQPTVPQGDQTSQEELVSKKELERLQKELAKERMEKNMLRNKAKKLEGKVVEVDDIDVIREAYNELLQEKEQREAEEQEAAQRREAQSFRDKVISEYPESVQEAAKKLIAKNTNNLTWDNAADWDDARSQLVTQLDALKEVIGVADTDDDTNQGIVHPNNPGRPVQTKRFEDMTLEEMKKVLPHADPR